MPALLVILLVMTFAINMNQLPLVPQPIVREVFTSDPILPSHFSLYKVDATVFQLPGAQGIDEPPSDKSSKAWTIGTGIVNASLGWAEKVGDNIAFFTGAINGSADAWTEIEFRDSKGIPVAVGPEMIDNGAEVKGGAALKSLKLKILKEGVEDEKHKPSAQWT